VTRAADVPLAVVVSRDPDSAARVARAAEAAGARTAVFVGDPEAERAALVEMIAELSF
jgi:hypothetical protein